MAQYIDKDVLIAEIDKLVDKGKYTEEYDCAYRDGINAVLHILKKRLNSIEVKEVDLEKEFYDFIDTLIGKDNGQLSEDELFRIAEYFFELGIKAQKAE